MTRKLIPAISPTTLNLIGLLRTLSDADKQLTKVDIVAAIGCNPAPYMQTAKRHLLQEHNLVVEYDRVHGVYRGMHGEANIRRRAAGISRVRRMTRVEAAKLSCTDFKQLSDAKKIEAAAIASTLGAIHQFTTPQGQKRIADGIQQAEAAGMPFAKTLALFNANGKEKV